MKKLSNLLWWVGVIVLVSTSYTFAYTQEQQEAYQWAYQYGITTQPTIEAANLDWEITRQAFAKMVVNYIENVAWVKQTTSNSCNFPDENKITDNLELYAKKTCAYNIMWSSWTAFNPMNSLSRAQLWTVLSRILWWDRHDSSWNWYYVYHVNALQDAGIMDDINDVMFIPAKRWDVMIMFKRMNDIFGSHVYMNIWNQHSYFSTSINNTTNSYVAESSSTNLSIESNVIYTWKDGTQYYYNVDFLNILKNEASKKWETDLLKYIEIEIGYLNSGSQFKEFDSDEFSKEIWIDFDSLDKDNLTKADKEEIVKKFWTWVDGIIDKVIKINDKYIEDLGKILKDLKTDKFWLKWKYEKTKTFLEAWNNYLRNYGKILTSILETQITANGDEDDSEWIAQALWLLWISLTYQSTVQNYQKYVEGWAINTINLLWLESDSPKSLTGKTIENSNNNLDISQKIVNIEVSTWKEENTPILWW